jgi:hypothetical protein
MDGQTDREVVPLCHHFSVEATQKEKKKEIKEEKKFIL